MSRLKYKNYLIFSEKMSETKNQIIKIEIEVYTSGFEIQSLFFKDNNNPVQPTTNIVIKNEFFSFVFIYQSHQVLSPRPSVFST